MKIGIDDSTPCAHCGTSALECGRRFRETTPNEWCCATCREQGALWAHSETVDAAVTPE